MAGPAKVVRTRPALRDAFPDLDGAIRRLLRIIDANRHAICLPLNLHAEFKAAVDGAKVEWDEANDPPR